MLLALLFACSPVALLPPISGDPGNVGQLGAGLTYDLGAEPGGELTHSGDAQFWYLRRLGKVLSLGTAAAMGPSMKVGTGFFGMSLGALGRFHIVDAKRFRLGTDVRAGLLHGSVALPLAVGLSDGFWLYTGPSLELAGTQVLRVPLGVDARVAAGWWLTAEGQWHYTNPSADYLADRDTTGAAISATAAISYRY